MEDILFREGCNDITCIDLRLLGGYNENISKNAQNELIAALMELKSGARTDFKSADRMYVHQEFCSK